METILKLLPASVIQGWIVTGLSAGALWVWARAQAAIKNSAESADTKASLTNVGETVYEIVQAEIKVTGGKLPTAEQLPAMEAQAEAVIKARWPSIEDSLESDLKDLIHHEVALKSAQHATLTLPTPINNAVTPKVGA